MHYLIDGYNFFFYVKNQVIPLEKHRTTFIAFLSNALANKHASLFFDSHFEHAEAFPRRHFVEDL